jgi:magnesium-transporting ATPase (P-type)
LRGSAKPGDVQLQVNDEKDKRQFGLGDKEWHLYSREEIIKELETDVDKGLTSEEHKKRFELYGPNEITPPKQTHWFIKFLYTLVGGFQLMLWFGNPKLSQFNPNLSQFNPEL